MPKEISHYVVLVTIILLAGLLAGCPGVLTTPIGKILENPRDYTGKEVTVSGEVTEVFGFFTVKYFVVKDRTGEITVVTQKTLPKKGNTVRIKGTVKEAFAIGDSQKIVITEHEGE